MRGASSLRGGMPSLIFDSTSLFQCRSKNTIRLLWRDNSNVTNCLARILRPRVPHRLGCTSLVLQPCSCCCDWQMRTSSNCYSSIPSRESNSSSMPRLERATHRLLQAPIGSLSSGQLKELEISMSYWATDRRTDSRAAEMVDALRCRLLQEVQITGQSLMNTSICQSILEGWILCSNPDLTFDTAAKALQLLDHMLEQYCKMGKTRMKPNVFVFSLVMDCFAQLAQYPENNDPFYSAKQVERLLLQMEELFQSRKGDRPNTTGYNIAIKAWANSASYYYEQHRVGKDALHNTSPAVKAETILLRMLESSEDTSCAPDTTTFNTVIHAWAESVHVENFASKAEYVLRRMISFSNEFQHSNVKPDTVSYTTVIAAYAKSQIKGAHLKAQQLLHEMEERSVQDPRVVPNTYSYNAVMNAIARSSGPEAPYQVEALLQRMITRSSQEWSNNNRPDLTSYNTVLHAWASSKVPGAAERTEEILRQMLKYSDTYSMKDVRPDIFTYNTLCDAIAKSGKEDSPAKILAIMKEMKQQRNIPPDTATYNALLSAYIRTGDKKMAPKRAESILSEMGNLYDLGDEKVKPNVFTFNQVIDAYAKSNIPNASGKAVQLLSEMQKKYMVKPDTVSFSSAIAAYANSGDPKSALEAESLLATMIKRYKEGDLNVKPNTFCFNGVTNAYVKSGHKNARIKAESMLHRMQEFDVMPDNMSFSLIIHAYTESGNRGLSKRAEAILEEMQTKYNVVPDVITFNTVLRAIANSREVDAPHRAEKLLYQMVSKKLSKETSVSPDSVSFASVINAWAYSNNKNSNIAVGAWRVLIYQLELVDVGFSESLVPTINHFNEVLKACYYAKGTREEKLEALNIAAQVLDYLRKKMNIKGYCKANQKTYALFIEAGVRHLDGEDDSEKRRKLIKYAFRICLEDTRNSRVTVESVLEKIFESTKSTAKSQGNRNIEYYQTLVDEVRMELKL